MKKIIALLISAVMFFCMMPLTAFAETTLSIVEIGDISAPVAGQKPDYTATYGMGYNFTTELDSEYMSYGVVWVDITSGERSMTTDEVFEAGHSYRAAVIAKAQPGYKFSKVDNYTTDVAGGINGKSANVYAISGYNAGEYVGITYTFAPCDYARIYSVGVTDLKVPASGEKFDFESTPKDDTYIISSVYWKDVTIGTAVNADTTAVPGHKYEVEIWLRANDNYRFKVDSEGYPDVSAKIGAYNATVIDSTSEGVVVGIKDTYIIPDDITSVMVTGIDAPITGETPDTEATCGSGYVIKEIHWVDKTGEYKDWITDITVFEPGRKYCVEVTLETISNYRFSTDYDGVTDVDAKINGENAIVYSDYSSTTVSIGYEFPLTEELPDADTIISTVIVDSIDAPVAGETPDTDAVCVEAGYSITEIIWVDSTDEYENWVYGVEVFEAGRKYTVQISLVTEEGYKFLVLDGYNEAKAVINGQAAIAYGSHSDTELSIGFEFETAPEEHTHEYSTVVTAPTCTEKGFTTYTCSCGDTYTADEKEATGHTPEVIPGKVATETETGLTDGEKCSVCGTVTKEPEIIPVLDKKPEILLGDVNKDGNITAADARLALRIAAKIDIPNEYQAVAANYNQDDKINAADARLILRKAARID